MIDLNIHSDTGGIRVITNVLSAEFTLLISHQLDHENRRDDGSGKYIKHLKFTRSFRYTSFE